METGVCDPSAQQDLSPGPTSTTGSLEVLETGSLSFPLSCYCVHILRHY